jgi:DNA-binding transcriptional regulator PaaX
MLEWEHFGEPSVVTVYLALLLHADQEGKTSITKGDIASITGLSHNTVSKAISKLVKSGEISRLKQGSKITTSITNWSEYQSTQNLVRYQNSSTQNLVCNDTKNWDDIDPKNGSIQYNKNNKNNKEIKQKEYAHAQGFGEIWDEWFGDNPNQTIENLCMHERVTIEELKDAAELAIIDLRMNGETGKLGNADKKKSLYGLMLFKLRKNKNNGQRTINNGNGKTRTVTGFKICNKQ